MTLPEGSSMQATQKEAARFAQYLDSQQENSRIIRITSEKGRRASS